MKLELHEPFRSAWTGRDPFDAAFALEGQIYRALEGRRTLRFEFGGRGYFAKLHAGIGWGAIVENLLTLKAPVLGARNEARAIRALEAAGVPTLRLVAFGERGLNPARQRSFIITEEIAPAISLEEHTRDWLRHPPPLQEKRLLLRHVADMTRRMQAAGINHRDFYLCHFLLDTAEPLRRERVLTRLIDLHRVRVRQPLPLDWRAKDLAALWYSARECGLSRRDELRFLRVYYSGPLRQALLRDTALWARVCARRERLLARKAKYGEAL